jgi:hypothetical protein
MIRILHVRHDWMMVRITVGDTLCGSKPPFDGCRVGSAAESVME